jgi:iron(III) transport system ATP-binding protein
MGREVGVLRGGRLVQTAEPTVLYREPVDLELARFVGEAVVLAGRCRGGVVDCVLGRGLPVRGKTLEGPVQVLIRPEQIRLSQGDGVAAEVVGSSYRGSDTVLKLALRDPAGLRISSRTFDVDLPAAGEEVRVEVAGSVAVFPEQE